MTIMFYILEIMVPVQTVDIAEDFDCDRYKENPEKFGNHMFDVRNAAQQNTSATPTK